MPGDGFVECVGLFGAFFSFVDIPLTTEHPVCCRGTWSFHRLPEHDYTAADRYGRRARCPSPPSSWPGAWPAHQARCSSGVVGRRRSRFALPRVSHGLEHIGEIESQFTSHSRLSLTDLSLCCGSGFRRRFFTLCRTILRPAFLRAFHPAFLSGSGRPALLPAAGHARSTTGLTQGVQA